VSQTGEFSLPPSLQEDSFLIWEEAEPDNTAGSDRWWLARAHDEVGGGIRDFFIAEDDISGYMLGVVRPRLSGKFNVIAATPLSEAVHIGDAVGFIKEQVAAWLAAPRDAAVRGQVRRWRRHRSWVIARDNLPLALSGLLVGALLGIVVALFSVSSGLVGWPMLITGVLIGAGAGWLLKRLADLRPHALPGSWGRFVLVTAAAITGTALSAGSIFTLFWN
jgi:hypothetical protein